MSGFNTSAIDPDTKQLGSPDISPVVEGVEDGTTITDARDMHRLGKVQEFRRNFSFLSTLGFISMFLATWEYTLVSLGSGFINGGFAGLFWVFIITVICYSSVVLSLAEMESMAPTSGGQYHWVSEFAPPNCQRFLSYSAGWMSTLGWLASTASSFFICATLVQSLVDITQPDFAFPNWQYTLLMLAFLVITVLFNTWGATSLPMVETVSLFGHLLGFFVVIIPVWVMAPRNSASDVFTNFVNSGGWSSVGEACLISQIAVVYCNFGADSIVHISEEVQDASWTVPRVMWWAYVLNVGLGIVALITMLFCIGPLEDALAADAPYLQLFNNTGSNAVNIALSIVLLLLIFAGNITALATTSREVFAFSRDKGLPFSKWLSRMDRKRHIPFNAVYFTTGVAVVICLIDLGSTSAFNIVISLNLLALMSTYIISIGCLTLKRLKGEPLPAARWSLGRWGLPINIFAFFYSIFIMIFSSFPTELPVDTGSANWAPAVWAGVLLISVVTYFVHGKNHFTAPVIFVEGHRVGGLQKTE